MKAPQTDKPPARGEPWTAWNDPRVPGLRLRFFPRGGIWYLYFRTRAGRQRNMKLGAAALFTLTAAREWARGILVENAKGNDPAKTMREAADRPTLEKLRDYHVERHVKVKLKPSAEKAALQAWNKDVLPRLKPKTAVADVTESDIADLHHAMRKRPVKANRVVAMLSKAFNLAEDEGWRPRNTNPVQVQHYPEKKRQRYPIGDEPIRLMTALDAERAGSPEFVALIELVCLTGARVGEIRTARKAWIRNSGLHLPDSKTDAKVVPLPALARDVIHSLPKRPSNPYLIPGAVLDQPLVNYHKPWNRVLKAAGIKGLHVHDLRRFFASAGLSRGETLSAIGRVLGHASTQTTMIYAFLMTDAAEATSEAAAKRVNELMRPAANAEADDGIDQ